MHLLFRQLGDQLFVIELEVVGDLGEVTAVDHCLNLSRHRLHSWQNSWIYLNSHLWPNTRLRHHVRLLLHWNLLHRNLLALWSLHRLVDALSL